MPGAYPCVMPSLTICQKKKCWDQKLSRAYPCVLPSLQVWYGIWLQWVLDGQLVSGQKHGRMSTSPLWWESTSSPVFHFFVILHSWIWQKRGRISTSHYVENATHMTAGWHVSLSRESSMEVHLLMAEWCFSISRDSSMLNLKDQRWLLVRTSAPMWTLGMRSLYFTQQNQSSNVFLENICLALCGRYVTATRPLVI